MIICEKKLTILFYNDSVKRRIFKFIYQCFLLNFNFLYVCRSLTTAGDFAIGTQTSAVCRCVDSSKCAICCARVRNSTVLHSLNSSTAQKDLPLILTQKRSVSMHKHTFSVSEKNIEKQDCVIDFAISNKTYLFVLILIIVYCILI